MRTEAKNGQGKHVMVTIPHEIFDLAVITASKEPGCGNVQDYIRVTLAAKLGVQIKK